MIYVRKNIISNFWIFLTTSFAITTRGNHCTGHRQRGDSVNIDRSTASVWEHPDVISTGWHITGGTTDCRFVITLYQYLWISFWLRFMIGFIKPSQLVWIIAYVISFEMPGCSRLFLSMFKCVFGPFNYQLLMYFRKHNNIHLFI